MNPRALFFHIREHKHQLYPWVKPKEWLDFELIWHLASLTEPPLPTHSLSQKQSLLLISAVGCALCWWENCLGWHKGPDSWSHLRHSWPGSADGTCKFLLCLVPIHTTPVCRPFVLPWKLWTPGVSGGNAGHLHRNPAADFGAVPGFWKLSFPSIHNLQENVCFNHYYLEPELYGQRRRRKKSWQVVGELIDFLCQFSPFSSQYNYLTSISQASIRARLL